MLVSLVTQALGQQSGTGSLWISTSTPAHELRLPAGVPLVASFAEHLTEAQRDWLCSTLLPLRRVAFHRKDGASTALFQTVCCAPFRRLSAAMQPDAARA